MKYPKKEIPDLTVYFSIVCLQQGVALAKHFELLIREDERFEIPARRHLGMVVFRLKGPNELTENLLKRLNSTGKSSVIFQIVVFKTFVTQD